MREGFQFHQMLLLLTGQIDSVFCKGFEQLLLAPTPTPLIASYLCYNRLTALLLLTSSLLVLALVLVIVKEGEDLPLSKKTLHLQLQWLSMVVYKNYYFDWTFSLDLLGLR